MTSGSICPERAGRVLRTTALILLLCCGPAAAQVKSRVSPSITVSQAVSHLSSQAVGTRDGTSYYALVEPRLSLILPHASGELRLDLGGSFYFHEQPESKIPHVPVDGGGETDTVRILSDSSVSLLVESRRGLTFRASDRFIAAPRFFEYPDQDPTNLSHRNIARVGFTYDFLDSDRTTLQISPEFMRMDIFNSNADYYQVGALLEGRYRILKHFYIYIQPYAIHIVRDHPDSLDNGSWIFRAGALAGVGFELSKRVEGKVGGGAGIVKIEGYDTFLTELVEGKISYDINSKTEVLFEGATSFGIQENGRPFDSYLTSITLSYELTRKLSAETSYSFSVFRLEAATPTGLVISKDHIHQVRVGLDYLISRSLEAKADYSYAANRGPNSDNDYDWHQFKVSMQWSM